MSQPNAQENRYPNINYNPLQTPDTPQGNNNRVENPEPRLNAQLNYGEQFQQGQPQLQPQLPMYYMPVQGPNGLMYVPVQAQMPQGMPVQGQVIQNVPPMQNIPQGQVFYGYPMMTAPRAVSDDCDCFSKIANYFRSMTPIDKYRFFLNVMSVFAFISMIMSIKMAFKRWHKAPGIFGLILSTFVFIALRKGVRAIKTKDLRGFKKFLRMAAAIFIINVYNMLMFLVFGNGKGRRCFGGFFGLLVLIVLSAYMCCKGRRLLKNVMKTEWRREDQQPIRVEPSEN